MSSKNKLLKWQVTQSKNLKTYSSGKEICPLGIRQPLLLPCHGSFLFEAHQKKKKKTNPKTGWGMLFFLLPKLNTKKLKIYLAMLNTEDCKYLS